MKNLISVLVGLVVLILVATVSYKAAASKYQSQIIRLKGEITIYKNQADKYAKIIRTIRETTQQASVTEKAQ